MNSLTNNFKINNLFKTNTHSSAVPTTNNTIILKGDSGATNHYISSNDAQILQNVSPNSTINVTLPNNASLNSTAIGQLPVPKLSTYASTAHVLPGLSNTSLLSLGQLADDNCLILLDKQMLHVFKNFELILQGY